MEALNIFSLLPQIILSGMAVFLILIIALYRNHRLTHWLTTLTFIASIASLFYVYTTTPNSVTPLFVVDRFSLFYSGIILVSGLAVVLMSYTFFQQQKEQYEEFYLMLLLASVGATTLAISTNFASLFLGLELLSISLYVLIGYLRYQVRAIEGAVKYLILAAVSSAFLLFGMALVYVDVGSMNFVDISNKLGEMGGVGALTMTGFSLMIVGVGFKLAVVPFHFWTPDVYEGASAPVTAFIATASKGGIFAVWLRFFIEVNGYQHPTILTAISIIAILSMFFGNLLALLQDNVKRILAYSSIAHFGYLLVAFLAGGKIGAEAASYYILAYIVTTLGAFGIVTALSDEAGEAEQLNHYRGLFWRNPLIAAVFTAVLFSLAGIPLTAGFIGKYYVIAAGVNATLWWVLFMLVISSVIGLYYYLRIIATMFYGKVEGYETKSFHTSPSLGGGIVLTGVTVMLLWLGIFPADMIDLVKSMVVSLY